MRPVQGLMEREIEGCEPLRSNFLGPICMQSILDRLVKTSPVSAMVRVALENILSPDFIDGIFRYYRNHSDSAPVTLLRHRRSDVSSRVPGKRANGRSD